MVVKLVVVVKFVIVVKLVLAVKLMLVMVVIKLVVMLKLEVVVKLMVVVNLKSDCVKVGGGEVCGKDCEGGKIKVGVGGKVGGGRIVEVGSRVRRAGCSCEGG